MELDQAIRKLLIKDPFYGLFLLNINRYYGNLCETACIARNGIYTELCVNKEFWDSLDDEMQLGVIRHEVGHILFNHFLMSEQFSDQHRLNVANDMEVNSYIPILKQEPYCYAASFGLEDQKGSKYYYEHLPEEIKNTGYKLVDDHSTWKDFQDLSEAEQQLIKEQIDYNAKQVAEHIKSTGGHIPNEFSQYIDSLFKTKEAVFNWKAYFRRLIGNSIIYYLKNTRYKSSYRFPDQPGSIIKSKPKVLVAVDTSGSINDDELSDFFTEIEHLYKSGVAVDIIEFDTRICKKFPYKGKNTKIEIKGRGGTDATEVFNFYKNTPGYSSLVIFTDGYLSVELPKVSNVIWVIAKDGARQQYPGKTIFIP